MTDVTLIQCTATKRDEPSIAQCLYDESAYFRKMRGWATARGDKWYILSAKHGLLEPNAKVNPYDERGLSETQTEEIAATLSDRDVDAVYVCAGRDYLDPLEPALEAVGIDVIDNFAGMRIGERMNELSARANDLTAEWM